MSDVIVGAATQTIIGGVTSDLNLELSRGNIPGMRGVNKFGRATAVGTVLTDIWGYAPTVPIWVPPTTAQLHSIVSDSVEDKPAGTGAHSIRVYGLTSWTTPEEYDDVTLDGTTSALTNKTFVVIYRAYVTGPVLPNTGNITITPQTDGDVGAYIAAGVGQTTLGVFAWPSTQTLHLMNWWGSCNKANSTGGVDLSLLWNPIPQTQKTGYRVRHTQAVRASATSFFDFKFTPYNALPGPGILKVQGIGTAAGFDISAGFDGCLLEDI